jgi:hypothetical protein
VSLCVIRNSSLDTRSGHLQQFDDLVIQHLVELIIERADGPKGARAEETFDTVNAVR